MMRVSSILIRIMILNERRLCSMFNNPRYLTAGVAAAIPEFLQLFMWQCIDRLPDDRDYLQVFRLEPFGGMQQIRHTSEQPAEVTHG